MYKLFIADDEAIIREGLRILLDWESLGFSVAGEAANGESAYNFMIQHNPELVLLDIRMPKMDGLSVICQAREHGFTGNVIILSSYSDFKYAQEACRYGVKYYLTKPVDEAELEDIIRQISSQLDTNLLTLRTAGHYRKCAHDTIIADILTGSADFSMLDFSELHLDADMYQVAIYEKYSVKKDAPDYRFSDLICIRNQDNHSFDSICVQSHEVILLKGGYAIQKFDEFIQRYQRELKPQKNSPLDSFFIAYGRCVHSLMEVSDSYQEAKALLSHRFYCEENQHTISYLYLPDLHDCKPIVSAKLINEYASRLSDALCAFNRSLTAEILLELRQKLYGAADPIDSVKLFLADLFLQIKEQIGRQYSNIQIPFSGYADLIHTICEKHYLYEIIRFFTEQFESIMRAIGKPDGHSTLDDIFHYINHNYERGLTLESIAPLFGYNSSYLGKIFYKKAGENFNSYLDHVRIQHAKELLLHDDIKVYEVAEKVGYRNVDYFHIKFKKYVEQTPAEFRRSNRVTG